MADTWTSGQLDTLARQGSRRAARGDWVRPHHGADVFGVYVGTRNGIVWVFYLGRGNRDDYNAMCERFDRATSRERGER